MRYAISKVLLAVPTYLLIGLGFLIFASFRRTATRGLRRWRYLFVGLFIWAYVVGAPVFGNAITYRLEQRYEPRPVVNADRHPDNLILVLTGGWSRWDGKHSDLKISEDGWERLDAGIKLWQQIGGTILIVGAPAPDGSENSIAAVMALAARDRGVPASALLVEPKSRDTHENFVFSLTTLQAHGDHLWLVTSAIHMARAMAVAHRLGLHPIPYPCFYIASVGVHFVQWLPANDGPIAFQNAMHEWLGILFYRLRGWA